MGDVGGRLIVLCYVVFLARRLDPALFGTYNAVLAYIAIAVAFSNVGLDKLALREFAARREHPALLSTLLGLRFVTAAVAAGLLLGLGGIVEPAGYELFGIAAAAMLPSAVVAVLTPVFQARERFAVPAVATLLGSVCAGALVVLGILSHAPISFFLWAWAGGEMLRAACLWIALGDGNTRGRSAPSLTFVRTVLSRAFPYGVLSVLAMLYLRVDLVMLELISGPTAVANYAVAYRIPDALILLPGLFLGVIAPRAALLQHKDPVTAGRLYLVSSRLLLWMGISIAGVGILISRPLVTGLFGLQYAGAVPTFIILLVALVFVFWHATNGAFLLVGDRLGPVTWLSAGFVLLNIIGNLLLIPRLQTVGAAVSTLACEAAAVVVFGALLNRRLGIGVRRYVASVCVPYFPLNDLVFLLTPASSISAASLFPAPSLNGGKHGHIVQNSPSPAVPSEAETI